MIKEIHHDRRKTCLVTIGGISKYTLIRRGGDIRIRIGLRHGRVLFNKKKQRINITNSKTQNKFDHDKEETHHNIREATVRGKSQRRRCHGGILENNKQ